jgi:hypothetical protein
MSIAFTRVIPILRIFSIERARAIDPFGSRLHFRELIGS